MTEIGTYGKIIVAHKLMDPKSIFPTLCNKAKCGTGFHGFGSVLVIDGAYMFTTILLLLLCNLTVCWGMKGGQGHKHTIKGKSWKKSNRREIGQKKDRKKKKKTNSPQHTLYMRKRLRIGTRSTEIQKWFLGRE